MDPGTLGGEATGGEKGWYAVILKMSQAVGRSSGAVPQSCGGPADSSGGPTTPPAAPLRLVLPLDSITLNSKFLIAAGNTS